MKHQLSQRYYIVYTIALITCLWSQCIYADKQKHKIIALAPHIVESLYEIGAGEQIIGTTEHADYPEKAKTIPRVGNAISLQVERIVELAPDLIIAWKSGNPSQDLKRLQQYGFEVVYSNPQTLEDVAAELTLLGELTGREQQASEAATRYLRQLSALRQQYSHETAMDVFYELWPQPLRTIANNAWPQQQLEVCGVNNVFAQLGQDYPLVSVEQVIAAQPQVIIQPVQGNDSGTAKHISWQQYKALPAVVQHQFLHPNADKVHRMTSRMLEELSLLCQQLNQARRVYK